MSFSGRIAYAASREVGFMAIYTILKTTSLRFCLIAGAALASLSLITALIILLVLLARVLLTSRKLISFSDETQTFLGKPLFFPVTLSHTRSVPISNKFTYRVLLIGVPVGLRCRIGHLLTVDRKPQSWYDSGEQKTRFYRPLFELASWFSFDSERYLHRGDEQLDLQKKLHRFLKDQVCDFAAVKRIMDNESLPRYN
jgi:Protein of unknown function (DUF1365)